MKARLAFAFSIHAEADILIIDEALSVGDVAFQRKCYMKIEEMCDAQNITVLFVSHSESVIKKLCTRAIIIHNGKLIMDGETVKVVNAYAKLMSSDSIENISIKKGLSFQKNEIKESSFYSSKLISKSIVKFPINGAEIFDIMVIDSNGLKVNILQQHKIYYFTYKVKFYQEVLNLKAAMQVKNKLGINIAGKSQSIDPQLVKSIACDDVVKISWRFKNILNEGVYFFNCAINQRKDGEKIILNRIIDALMIKVIQNNNNTANGLIDMNYQINIEKDGSK
jgi:lipopolysaccharide transport system ATP-binding protein